MLVSINRECRLYNVKSGPGYSCLGFDYADHRACSVASWIGDPRSVVEGPKPGTREHFALYERLMARGAAHHEATGERCDCELEPKLKGLEGWRVEVTAPDGTRERFIVGKSTGWMPCHIALARRDSHGGPAAYVPNGATVRRLYKVR